MEQYAGSVDLPSDAKRRFFEFRRKFELDFQENLNALNFFLFGASKFLDEIDAFLIVDIFMKTRVLI